ncbi:MAG: CBS domain-containing protein [Candidatus Omnitrophota bacterium]
MTAKDIMTRNVSTISPETTLHEAAEIMKNRNIGMLPVAENSRIVGILTDRDIVVRAISRGKDPDSYPVKNAMSKKIDKCFEDQDLEEVAQEMEKLQIRRIPVFDHADRLVGVISLGDFVLRYNEQKASEVLHEVSKPGPSS